MSAYIVEKKTIDRIVTYINEKCSADPDYFETRYAAIYAAYRGDPNKLGQNLWTMNVKAVDQRYRENNPVSLYRYEYRPADNIQVFKSLRGYLYQCTEGDVPESPLYKDLDRLADTIAREIVINLPAYERAEWA